MQRPTTLAPADYAVALKPLLGREKKFKISTAPAYELAGLKIDGVNSLTAIISTAMAAALLARPSEVLIKCEEELRDEASLIIGVVGTDALGAVLSGTCTFAPPAYAQDAANIFPAGSAREVVVASGKKFKTITAFVPTQLGLAALGGKFSVFGMPDLSTYTLVGCRVSLDYTAEHREPVAIACGGDDSAFVKPGQKPKRDVSITVKLPSLSDGLARYNGISNLCGLAVSDKEDKLVTDHEFLIGLIVTGKFTNPEASEPSTLAATGVYEDYAHLPAN